MFEKAVAPILLYGSEVWGFENLEILEKVHLRFCKIILGIKQSTPSNIVYGELRRYPLLLTAKIRFIKFWCRLVNGDENKISSV